MSEEIKEEQELNEKQEQTTSGKDESSQEDSKASEESAKAEEEKKELSPEEKIEELNNKYVRLYSEFENFRRRNAKEKMELVSTATESLMTELLPVLDDISRAESSIKEAKEVEAVKEGVDLIFNKFRKTLENKGLKPFEDQKGKEFDADLHEAVTQIPAPTEDLKGKIVDEIEKGYLLNDKIIRFSKVVTGN